MCAAVVISMCVKLGMVQCGRVRTSSTGSGVAGAASGAASAGAGAARMRGLARGATRLAARLLSFVAKSISSRDGSMRLPNCCAAVARTSDMACRARGSGSGFRNCRHDLQNFQHSSLQRSYSIGIASRHA